MIKYLTHNQIDKEKWDNCISLSFNGNVYAWSWYLDIVHPNWEALVEDNYKRVMPLTGGRKFGINYLYQPFFVQQLGVFSQKQLSSDVVSNFISSIPSKYRFAEIRLNIHNKFDSDTLIVDCHRNVELDLISDYDSLYKNYNNNTKRNLAKAHANDIVVVKQINPEMIINLFRNNKGKDVIHWGKKEYDRLLQLIYTAIYHDSCLLYGAVRENSDSLVAGAVFMFSHDRIVFLFSGADESNTENHALTLVLDYVIHDFSGTQNTLDFEGSDSDSLARFYKGFGGKELYYNGVNFNKLNGLAKWALRKWKGK